MSLLGLFITTVFHAVRIAVHCTFGKCSRSCIPCMQKYAIQTIDGESQIKSVCVKSIALAFKIGYSTNLLFCIIQDQSQHP